MFIYNNNTVELSRLWFDIFSPLDLIWIRSYFIVLLFIGNVAVYCACCLASHRVQGLGTRELRPHFYVSVADIEALENEISYVACK